MAWGSSSGYPQALGHYSHNGDQEEVLGSSLWIEKSPAILATWERMKRQTNFLFVSPHLCMSHFVSINENEYVIHKPVWTILKFAKFSKSMLQYHNLLNTKMKHR